VIDESTQHFFQPQLLYIAFKGESKPDARDERKLLKRHVKFVNERVTEVNLNERIVKTANVSYSYDFVVIATGIVTNTAAISGLGDVNSTFGDYHTNFGQAKKLWNSLNKFAGGTIAIGQSYPLCKCPPSPLEGAFLTEEFIRKKGLKEKTRIIFFTPYPRAYPAEGINEIVAPMLKSRGIEVMTFFDVDRIDSGSNTIYSIEGDSIKYDLPIIVPPCTGITSIKYTPDSILDRDHLIIVDKYTSKVKGFDDAFAIGDAAALPTSKAGVGAHLEAKVVAKRLSGEDAKFNGRTNCPFDTGYGKGTFVIGSYDEPVVKYPVTRMNLFMKHMMEKIYWGSLKGTYDFIFDMYFNMTSPEKLKKKYGTGTVQEPQQKQ
jgi:sulfide:quinone oxidoreductase